MSEPPVPPTHPSGETEGEPVPTADLRKEFARESRAAPRDPDAERAFIENKIEMIRSHPTLSAAGKEAAITALLQQMEEPTEDTESGGRPGADSDS